MTDYSKPTGHWCDACGRAHRPDVISVNCDTIPVYAIIPEGERPETHDETHECVEAITKGNGSRACGFAVRTSSRGRR